MWSGGKVHCLQEEKENTRRPSLTVFVCGMDRLQESVEERRLLEECGQITD